MKHSDLPLAVGVATTVCRPFRMWSMAAAWCVNMRSTPRATSARRTAGLSGAAGCAKRGARAGTCDTCTTWPSYHGSDRRCASSARGCRRSVLLHGAALCLSTRGGHPHECAAAVAPVQHTFGQAVVSAARCPFRWAAAVAVADRPLWRAALRARRRRAAAPVAAVAAPALGAAAARAPQTPPRKLSLC
eukprot:179485-Chlamydomonas_euryale.AAC.1